MALKGRKNQLTAELVAHPSDPRIAETNSRESFEQIRLSGKFKGAVLHRYDDPTQGELHKTFKEIWDHEPITIGLNNTFRAFITPDGDVNYDRFPYDYRDVESEFTAMAQTFSLITGETEIEFLIFENLTTEPDHDHPYPVMNCTWLHDGSVWKNEKGEQQQIAEGNWFFFEPGFRHNSPERQSGRFTIIVKPVLYKRGTAATPEVAP